MLRVGRKRLGNLVRRPRREEIRESARLELNALRKAAAADDS